MAAQAQVSAKSKTERVESTPEEQIRLRAYEIYLARGSQAGSELDDWLQAEAEPSSRQGKDSQRKKKTKMRQSLAALRREPADVKELQQYAGSCPDGMDLDEFVCEVIQTALQRRAIARQEAAADLFVRT